MGTPPLRDGEGTRCREVASRDLPPQVRVRSGAVPLATRKHHPNRGLASASGHGRLASAGAIYGVGDGLLALRDGVNGERSPKTADDQGQRAENGTCPWFVTCQL